MKSRIIINTPDDIHNTYGISIQSSNPALVNRFEEIMTTESHKNKNWFYQGGHDSFCWKYFEFFGKESQENQDYIINLTLKIADILKMDIM